MSVCVYVGVISLRTCVHFIRFWSSLYSAAVLDGLYTCPHIHMYWQLLDVLLDRLLRLNLELVFGILNYLRLTKSDSANQFPNGKCLLNMAGRWNTFGLFGNYRALTPHW